MPPGPRQVASAVTGDATQIHIAEGANKRPVRYLLADLCATGFSDWTRSAQDGRAGACCSCPSLVAAARGSAQPSALRVIEIYQGLIRPFQRLGKTYELRCG